MRQIFSLKTRMIATLVIILIYLGLFWFFTSNELGELPDFFFTTSWYFSSGIGGVFALFAAHKYGINNSIGKFLIFTGLGLLSSLIGTLIWDYHIFILGTDTPYPSIADVFYILPTPLIAIGLIFLLNAYSVNIKKKFIWLGGLLALILFGTFISIQGKELFLEIGEFQVAFFNIVYNLNDSIALPMALMALVMMGGKIFKGFSIFVIGFLLQAVANLTFGFRNLYEIYYFGDISDVFFVLSSAIMSIGIIVVANGMSQRKGKVEFKV